MAIYIIENNVVINCVEGTLASVGEYYQAAELIERVPGLGFDIGWRRVNNVWTAPEPTTGPRIISSYEFRNRFTDAEQNAILGAAYGGDAVCRKLLLKLQTAANGVDLEDQIVTGGVNYLYTIGILTSVRVIEVLS